MSAAAIVTMMQAHLVPLMVERTVLLCEQAAQAADRPAQVTGVHEQLGYLVALRDWARRHGGRAVPHGPSGVCEGHERCAACTLEHCEICDRDLPPDGVCGSCAAELEEEAREQEREAYLDEMAERQAEDWAAQGREEMPW